jgi:hypothetical protein
MNITNKTNMTSTKGVTLISAIMGLLFLNIKGCGSRFFSKTAFRIDLGHLFVLVKSLSKNFVLINKESPGKNHPCRW